MKNLIKRLHSCTITFSHYFPIPHMNNTISNLHSNVIYNDYIAS